MRSKSSATFLSDELNMSKNYHVIRTIGFLFFVFDMFDAGVHGPCEQRRRESDANRFFCSLTALARPCSERERNSD